MGGPTIVDFSSMKSSTKATLSKKRAKSAAKTNDMAGASTSSAASSSPPPSSSPSPRPTRPPSSSTNSNSFRKTVFLPSLYALIVFVTWKQLAAGPKLWQAAKFVADTVHQKAVKLSYQPVLGPVQESYSLAYQESFGFFDYIKDSDWTYRKQLAQTRQDSKDGANSLRDTSNPKTWYMNNFYPFFSCPGLLRIGRSPGVGPKYVCDPHRIPQIVETRRRSRTDTSNNGTSDATDVDTDNNHHDKCLVYSVGNPYYFDFEKGLINLLGDVCEIHVFHDGDLGLEQPNMHFHKWNIRGSSSQDTAAAATGKTWQETIAELGHANRVIDIMKIDCVGCEWTDYTDWVQQDIRQLLVLTHNPPPNAADMFHGLIDAGYAIFAREANINPYHSRGNNLMVEWSFLKLHKNFTSTSE